MQAAIPQILEKTKEEFYSNIIAILRRCADICFDRLQEIPCITCPSKPEGSMFLMVRALHIYVRVSVSAHACVFMPVIRKRCEIL